MLLSDDRKCKAFIGPKLMGFAPKPLGSYPITEAIQTMEGDYTAPWQTERRMYFKKGPKWDFSKIFGSDQFMLDRYTDEQRLAQFSNDINRLEKVCRKEGFSTVRVAHEHLVLHHAHDLALLIDCGLLKYYGGNFATASFEPDKYPMDEAETELWQAGRPVPRHQEIDRVSRLIRESESWTTGGPYARRASRF